MPKGQWIHTDKSLLGPTKSWIAKATISSEFAPHMESRQKNLSEAQNLPLLASPYGVKTDKSLSEA